jgi:hypothetical protein
MTGGGWVKVGGGVTGGVVSSIVLANYRRWDGGASVERWVRRDAGEGIVFLVLFS